jgi:hypothetical protein
MRQQGIADQFGNEHAIFEDGDAAGTGRGIERED